MNTPVSNRPSAAAPRGPASIAALRMKIDQMARPDVADLHDKSSNELAELRTHLALDRNLMAADRTLMAWVRTSLSLFSFGFTIYKILQEFQRGGATLPQDASPRTVGLFLSAMGTIAMVMGAIEYWQSVRELRAIEKFRVVRAPLVMAFLMSVLGVVLLFSISLQLF